MRILLDTNIIIHREASKAYNKDIGLLFNWIDKLKYEKWVHYLSITEIEKYKDSEVVETMKIKIDNYHIHKFDSEETSEISELRKQDQTENDNIDTSLLKEVFSRKFDVLITQDKKLYKKSIVLGIQNNVYSIDSFLEKVNSENPALRDYKVLAVKKEFFGKINIHDTFFNSFKEDYIEFENWFLKKKENEAYICLSDENVRAFLYLKIEDSNENYFNINPILPPKKRMKIGTLKVESTGYKLGERFLKIIFDNALINKVDEIYVTIFNKTEEQQRLIELLKIWGFTEWGTKETDNGVEMVLIRDFIPPNLDGIPKHFFPFIKKSSNKYFVAIKPDYHTQLLTDSKLKNENVLDYSENKSFSNAIQKAYISRSINKNILPGDILVFYRMKGDGPARFTSVITSIGIVENIFTEIKNFDEFMSLCKKRTVFTEEELQKGWDGKSNKPFVVHFLFNYSFPKRLTLGDLINLGIVSDVMNAPRVFQQMSDEHFNLIISNSNTDENFIID